MRGSRLTPADRITLGRGGIVILIAALALTSAAGGGSPRTWWVAGLAALVWALDGLDGYVARRTGTVSDRGALLDSGVDGSLVLVMTCVLAPVAPWALVGGLLYPAFLLGQLWRPAWRRTLPHSARGRLAGGTFTGTVVIASAPLWPDWAVHLAVGLAVAVVAWSFSVDIRWLERQERHTRHDPQP